MFRVRPVRALTPLATLALVPVGLTLLGATAQPRPAAARADVEVLRQKVAFATRTLSREKILTSSGHVSARIPGTTHVVIGPFDKSRETLRPADLVTVDLDSKKIAGGQPPREVEIHTGVYRARPDVMAVIHGHPVHSVVFSVTNKPILAISVHGAIFAEGVPVFPFVGQIDTRELGDGLAATLGPRRAALIKMHGTVVAGASVGEAFVTAIQLEENAEKQLWAMATGPVEPMNAEEVERSIRQSFSKSSIEKRWEYYQEREREVTRALTPSGAHR